MQETLGKQSGNSSKSIIDELKGKPWKKGQYEKQSWGIWLHRMSPYVGRIKPSFAHWLISLCSKPNDVILDPFCGVGTVLLEADLLGRIPIGVDLNPYAITICKAKFDRRNLSEELDYLRKIKLDVENVDLEKIPKFIREYYHPQTLKEIIALRNKLIDDERFFLLGCLLGIAHGHRPTQHLSIVTGYIIPYIPKPKPKVEYREVIPRMIKKVERMYKNEFPLKTPAKIYQADARNLPLKDNSTDVVISSPPYYDTLDYASSNMLRLGILGLDAVKQEELKSVLIQNRKTYIEEMKKTAIEIRRILKPNKLCIFVLGDVHNSKSSINTAEKVADVYRSENFDIIDIIPDEIPREKTTIVKFGGEDAIKRKKVKMDRILVMVNRKS